MSEKKPANSEVKQGYQPVNVNEGYQPTSQGGSSTLDQGAQPVLPTLPNGGTAQSSGSADSNTSSSKK